MDSLILFFLVTCHDFNEWPWDITYDLNKWHWDTRYDLNEWP